MGVYCKVGSYYLDTEISMFYSNLSLMISLDSYFIDLKIQLIYRT